MDLLYVGCRALAFPLLVFYFLFRGIRNPRYFRNFMERLGGRPEGFQQAAPGSIWVHAVSVGEVISAVSLIRELRLRAPGVAVFVSTTTLAGRALAAERLSGIADAVFYAPIDYGFAVRRVLRRIRPSAVVILETEIWPLLYREVKRVGCALLIVNGRISDRAFPSYRRWRFIFRRVLALPDAILVQSEQDGTRYAELGAPPGVIRVSGNLKYDVTPKPGQIPELMVRLRPELVWIAASTMPGIDASDVDEDDAVVQAFREVSAQYPRLLLILAPRKPERFDEAERKLSAAGLSFERRSRGGAGQGIGLPCVLLLDTIGELAGLFPFADVVFLGGTLARRGGHNILEAAACGKPVIVGPHMENFAGMAAEFRAGAGLFEITTPGELGGAAARLLADRNLREELGSRAAALAVSQGGATQRGVDAIVEAHSFALPVWRRAGVTRPLLWELSKLWIWGGRVKRRRTLGFHLDAPVISIGGIGMGGAGKTPFTDLLAGRLQVRGHTPAILTRGYRRRSVDEVIVVPAGTAVPAIVTGDEPQIFIRSGKAHVGIGDDRWAAGRVVEERLAPDLFLLDDGFQHSRLDRNLDIVLIDALDPFGGEAVFPLGGLREPLGALSRADAFVITRAEHGRSYRGIEERLRRFQPGAPVFHASVLPRYWVNHANGERSESAPGPAVAFCGLGNPASFWQTLRSLGVYPRFRWAFGDHHRYRTAELRRLRRHAEDSGAQALLTTEKDAMNLPGNALDLVKPCEIWWLRIESELWEEAAFMKWIEATLGRGPHPPAGLAQA